MLQALALCALLAAPRGRDAAPPTLRLPAGVKPVRQAVELSLDPNLETYAGSIEIELEIKEPTNIVWLNVTGLKITEAALGQSDPLRAARVVPGGDDFAGFSPASPLAAGPAR